MRYTILSLIGLVWALVAEGQSKTLKITLKENAPVTAYLYRNQGSTLIPVDSVMLGKGVFKFKTDKYQPGVYSFVLSEEMFARFIINNEDVELQTSLENLSDSLKVIHSEENNVYYSFLHERQQYNKKMEALTTLLSYYPKKGRLNRALLREKLAIEKKYNEAIRAMINAKGDLLASKIILAELPIKAPEDVSIEEQRQYLISNWWSSFPFECPYIINTPTISDKLWDYIDLFYVDGASREEQAAYFKRSVDEVMNQPGVSPEVQAFFKKEMIKTFSQSSYDALVDYIQKSYSQPYDENIAQVNDDLSRVALTAIGKAAPDFAIETDTLKTRLSQLHNNGTVILFWSMECSHCRKMLPDFVRNYKKMKDLGFEIVAVNLDAYRPAWKAYVKEKGFQWININVQNPYDSPITYSYNVAGTPLIYVLDQEKRIFDKPADATTTLKSLERLADSQSKKAKE